MGEVDHCSARLTRVIEGRDQGNETGDSLSETGPKPAITRRRAVDPVRARPAGQMRQAGQVVDLAWRGLAQNEQASL